jgi:hypothetical protein
VDAMVEQRQLAGGCSWLQHPHGARGYGALGERQDLAGMAWHG